MQIQDIRQRLRALAARPVHEDRILRAWLQARALDQRNKRQSEHYYPLSLREGLPALQADLDALARISSVHPGSDGSARRLVESVRLPRGGVCISTQVSCMIKTPNCSPRQHAASNQRS